tara:strand:+ start:336 stop:1016 length:681 start_codon:yes stop_codon:yes gene_type:complete
MKPIISIIILSTFIFAQDADTSETSVQPETASDTTTQSVPSGLESGYKGLAWGSVKGSEISTSFTPISNLDTLSSNQSFVGSLGPDSVKITYFFSDSGFWKVEIDFVMESGSLEKKISDFRRLEKNISAVYGPPQKLNHKESGASGGYGNLLDQKFATAFYRSTWSFTPAMIELLLNSAVLLPQSDLPIFSGNFSVMKLVYYNPDFMHSSQPMPEPEAVPSIFDIY